MPYGSATTNARGPTIPISSQPAPRLSRRSFLQGASLAIAGTQPAAARIASAFASTPQLFYMDGYHGGLRGHMPPGCWRDILSALKQFPRWKISLDIEPSSWEVLAREDPQAFTELADLLQDTSPSARVEMVAGTFAQPYGWAISGESNIRQLQRGLEIIRASFPNLPLSTYAVQEPCWASCLPQILRSLGFEGAALRDASTAWAGYATGKDAELVQWIGPDGTGIATVPRYALERLQQTYETESVDATAEFSQRCVDHGIAHPAGMCFQDLGWPAKPRLREPYIRFATWREYIHTIAHVTEDWRFGIEDTRVSLPWGDPTLRRVAQQVRSAEIRLVYAEKLATLACLTHHAPFPSTQLQEAWDQLLLSQAHDAWITATTRSGRQAWSFAVASETLQAEESANHIAAAAAAAISSAGHTKPGSPLGAQWARVINSLAFARQDLVQLSLATDPGTASIRVRDSEGHVVVSQSVTTRRYASHLLQPSHATTPDASAEASGTAGINHAVVSFRAEMPALGYATYQVEPIYTPATDPHASGAGASGVTASVGQHGIVRLESDLYTILLDPRKGGAITSLFARQFGKEFCDPTSQFLFHELRGYFIEQKAWCSSTETDATITLVEPGPVRAAVSIKGAIGPAVFQTRLELTQGQRRIDLQTRLSFPVDTFIGDPVEVPPEQRRSNGRRSQNDGRWKLQAMFPVALPNGAIYKNAAFDVCRSGNADTSFQNWNEIKHNIIVDWVDLFDAQQRHGLAVFSDHTTAYTHGPDHPLSLVMGWAWDGGFWWGKSTLRGDHDISYSVVPHQGQWDEASLHRESARRCEPPLASLIGAAPGPHPQLYSLLETTIPGLEISALLMERGATIVRFYNAEAATSDHSLHFTAPLQSAERIALDGSTIEVLTPSHAGRTVRLTIPRFGLCTLRCRW